MTLKPIFAHANWESCNKLLNEVCTVKMQIFADCFGIAASIVLQTAIDRGHHLLEALDPIAHIPLETFASPLILTKVNVSIYIVKFSLETECQIDQKKETNHMNSQVQWKCSLQSHCSRHYFPQHRGWWGSSHCHLQSSQLYKSILHWSQTVCR